MTEIATEADWLACTDPRVMRIFLRRGVLALVDQESPERREVMRRHLSGITDPRKLGLFACACCRYLWPLLNDERSRRAVEVTEQYLDGAVDVTDLMAAASSAVAARGAIRPSPGTIGEIALSIQATRAAARAAEKAASFETEVAAEESATAAVWASLAPSMTTALADQASLLRDIIGNPFRPVVIDTAWRTSTVLALARGAYDERAFGRMPILADALQDAGCDNDDVLNHCRDDTVHARGCWVVDLVLGSRERWHFAAPKGRPRIARGASPG